MKGITQEMYDQICKEYGMPTAVVAKTILHLREYGYLCFRASQPQYREGLKAAMTALGPRMAYDFHVSGVLTDKGLEDMVQIIERLEYAANLEASDEI